MIRYFIRFASPGRIGYIPGTSRYKYRHDWIDLDAIVWDASLYAPTVEKRRVTLHHGPDDSSEHFKAFWLHGTVIDNVVIEMAKADGYSPSAALFRFTIERAEIYSVSESSPERSTEMIVLDAGKVTAKQLSYSPDATKRAGLDFTRGFRTGARLA